MDRVQFACPECGKTVIVDRKYLGLSAVCPGCLKTVAVPLGASAFVPPEEAGPPETPEGLAYKRCPYCTEYVSPHAKKCKHCGHRLDVEGPSSGWELGAIGPKTSRLAIATLAFAVVPVLSVLGIFCGHAALRKIRRSSVLYKGEALAEWGLGLAYTFSVGYFIAFLIWLFS